MQDITIGAMHEAQRGLWAKTNFYRTGNTLHAVSYLVIAGQPEVFRASVDLSRIERAVERHHDSLHGKRGPEVGKFGDRFKKFVRKIGRTKLIRKIGKGVKSIVRSKITGGILAAASFIPGVAVVSGPALAAYGAANIALDRAGEAKAVAKGIRKLGKKASRYKRAKRRVKTQAKNLIKTVKRGRRVVSALRKGGYVKKTSRGYMANLKKLSKLSPAVLAKLRKSQRSAASAKAAISRYKKIRALKKLAASRKRKRPTRRRPPTLRSKADEWKRLAMLKKTNPAAFAKLQKMGAARAKVKADKAAYAKLAALKSNPKAIAALKEIGAASREQQDKLRALVARSRNPSDKAKQTEAIKALMVLRLVAKNRAKLKAIASASRGGAPGLLIDNRGRIIRGKFAKRRSRAGETSDLLYTGAPGASERGHFSRISGEVGACIPMPVRVAGNALDDEYFMPNVGCDDNPACHC
jgi:hypothetical protein